MNGKNMLEGRTGPVTQSVDAIKSLLAYVGRASDPLPSDVSLENGRMMLILSNKKDAYYTCTAKTCSCPSAAYRPGQSCKHQRKFFGESRVVTKPKSSEPLVKRGGFKPFDELPGEKVAKAAPSLSAIDCHETTVREAAYHEMMIMREMWPVEA
jgi:hypothetical protein